MDLGTTIGMNVRKIRNSKKLSQEELAFRAGIDRSYLSQIENGHKTVGTTTLDLIAKALNVNITALFSGYKGR